MKEKNDSIENPAAAALPFPEDWIETQPWKVEEILAGLPVADQARCVMALRGKQKRDFLQLSPHAGEVVRALPVEELYQSLKDIGESDALAIIAQASQEQLQFVFDLEWWQGDKFQPQKALEWLTLLDQCGEPQALRWFQSEESDKKVTLLQALIKVYKRDEMTDSYENTEQLAHFTPDGVYDIYFLVEEHGVLKKLLLLLHAEDPPLFFSLMEAVIWYPRTPTLENAYRWRLTRTAEHGIPEYTEAIKVYHFLDPQTLRDNVAPKKETLPEREESLPPQYVLTEVSPSSFLATCLSGLSGSEGLHAMGWELAALANKVLVADRADPTDREQRRRAVRKVLGYIDIGLESGASSDPDKGKALLRNTWLQFLFQAGHHTVMHLKWNAEAFLKEHGKHLDYLLTPGDKDQLAALVVRFPQVGEYAGAGAPLDYRDFERLADIHRQEAFLNRWKFYLRFSKFFLDLSERKMNAYLEECDVPENRDGVDLLTWVTTALARFVLFQEIGCKPLPEPAARSFLEMIFVLPIRADEGRVCDEDLIETFHRKILETGMAWTDSDREYVQGLLAECTRNLNEQFGSLNFKGPIEWKYTHGLCVTL